MMGSMVKGWRRSCAAGSSEVIVWFHPGSGGVDHVLKASVPSPRASFEEVHVAWQCYEEADAEQHCKKVEAEGVARGRRMVLVRREGGAE